jgi:hypothetical protein
VPTKRLDHIPSEEALFKYFKKNARYNEDAPADSVYSCAGLFAGDTGELLQKLKKAWKEDIKKHQPEKKEDITMPKTLEQLIREQLNKEQAKKEQKEGGLSTVAKMQKSIEGKPSGVNSIKISKDDGKKLTKISKKSSSVFADKRINTEGMLMKFVKAMEEERGVSEHPKATARKKKETEASHVGSGKVKEIYKDAEKLKGAPGVDNPWALAHWQKEKKFSGERKAAAEKAARSRKRNS